MKNENGTLETTGKEIFGIPEKKIKEFPRHKMKSTISRKERKRRTTKKKMAKRSRMKNRR